MNPKNSWSSPAPKQIFSPKNCWPQKNIAPQKMFEIMFGPPKKFVKKNLSKKIGPKKCGPQQFWFQKHLVSKNVDRKIIVKNLLTKMVNKSSRKCWLDFIKSTNKNKLKLSWEKP